MNKTTKLFYGLAVVYLLFTVVTVFTTYQGLSASAADYGVNIWDEWQTVFMSILSAAGGYLGFSFVFYGIALIFKCLNSITAKK